MVSTRSLLLSPVTVESRTAGSHVQSAIISASSARGCSEAPVPPGGRSGNVAVSNSSLRSSSLRCLCARTRTPRRSTDPGSHEAPGRERVAVSVLRDGPGGRTRAPRGVARGFRGLHEEAALIAGAEALEAQEKIPAEPKVLEGGWAVSSGDGNGIAPFVQSNVRGFLIYAYKTDALKVARLTGRHVVHVRAFEVTK